MGRIKYQEAIGLEVKRGRPPAGPPPSKADLVKLYIEEEKSVRDVAAALGCTKDMVHRRLKEFGIDARSCASRSKLRVIALDVLEAGVKADGVRGYALKLGVSMGTLYHHLKTRESFPQKRKRLPKTRKPS
jgi:transposase-like protein